MFYVLMAILVTAVALLMFNHESGELFGYPIEMVASVTLMSSWLIYLLSGRIGGGSARSAFTALKQAAIWILIGFGLVLGYSFKDEAKMLVNRVAGELVPGMGITADGGAVSFARSDNGHFIMQTMVNGKQVPMMLDTGASTVALRYEDAQAIGIDVENLVFSNPVSTANGRTLSARIWIKDMSVGGILRHRVAALVSQPDSLDQSLLGMSYLEKLGGWTVSGDKLKLEP